MACVLFDRSMFTIGAVHCGGRSLDGSPPCRSVRLCAFKENYMSHVPWGLNDLSADGLVCYGCSASLGQREPAGGRFTN